MNIIKRINFKLIFVIAFIVINLVAITFGVRASVKVNAVAENFSMLYNDGSNGAVASMGTQNYPYLIKDYDTFLYFMEQVNAGATTKNVYFSLQSDIDVYHLHFCPIGTSTYPFQGYFNGNNHIIKGLTYDYTYNVQVANYSYIGLFGHTVKAEIKNVILDSVDIWPDNNTEDTQYIGGLIGYARQTNIEYCSVLSGYIGHSDETCYVGGLIGYASSYYNNPASNIRWHITQCANFAQVAGWSYAGGIVCRAVSDTYFNSNYSGNFSYISECANYGEVSVYSCIDNPSYNDDGSPVCNRDNSESGYAGGIVGCMYNHVYILDCYNGGDIGADSSYDYDDIYKDLYLGGIVGYAGNGCYIKAVYNSGIVDQVAASQKLVWEIHYFEYMGVTLKGQWRCYYCPGYTYSGIIGGGSIAVDYAYTTTEKPLKTDFDASCYIYCSSTEVSVSTISYSASLKLNEGDIYAEGYNAWKKFKVSQGTEITLFMYKDTISEGASSWTARLGYSHVRNFVIIDNPLFVCSAHNSVTYNTKASSSLPYGFNKDSKCWQISSNINGGYPSLIWRYWELCASDE